MARTREVVIPDSRGRVALRKLTSHVSDRYLVETREDGAIVLVPAMIVRAVTRGDEERLLKYPALAAAVKEARTGDPSLAVQRTRPSR